MLSVGRRGHFFWINLLSWVDNANKIWYSEQGLANANKMGWTIPANLFDARLAKANACFAAYAGILDRE